MLTRRTVLQNAGAGVYASSLLASQVARCQDEVQWRMPDEAEPHLRTWMAFTSSTHIWGSKLLPQVQNNLAELARTIAKYEPVSMLVHSQDRAKAQELVQGANVTLVEAVLDDVWLRDTAPVFVENRNQPDQRAAVGFNFNGWGHKQVHTNDAKVAAFVADYVGVPRLQTTLVLEGGGIEVDGAGTAIVTESCVLNPNRNPNVDKAVVQAELQRLLGVRHIIWLPGIKGRDITDGHTDFYARFAGAGVVLAGFDADPQSYDHRVTKEHLRILRKAKDANGNPLEVVVLQAPQVFSRKYVSAEFAAGYVGFYLCNGAVIAQKFGDAKADSNAKKLLQHAFPARTVELLSMDAIAAGGGSVHCVTQQESSANSPNAAM